MQQQLGSGKTAVLVERIINKVIKDKVDIDKILIVTFTNAAAAEMRERILDAIYKKLDENPEDEDLQRQIVLLNKASICTIHSFCLDVIRNHFYELDIPANFRVADTGEIELLKQDVLEDIFEEKYLNNDRDFLSLINTYTGYRDDEALKDLVLNTYRFIQSSPFPMQWLEEKTEMFNIRDKKQDFNETIWGKILLSYLSDVLQDGIIKLENLVNDMKKYDEVEKYTNVISNDIDNLKALYNNLDSWDKAYKMSNISWEKWPVDRKISLQIKDDAKKVRDEVKKKMVSEINKIMKYSSEEANTDISDMYDTLRKLKNLVGEFYTIFSIRKREKNIIDFNDIEHFALKLLINRDENGDIKSTNIAREYMEKFQEIAIDEYQDSNLVQEYILSSISRGNNIFMVGDVKQSIYKFRQARPELFLEKYEKYSDILDGKNSDVKIKLFKNFRSRSSVLDYTNLVFENIMSKEAGDILYNDEEYLNLGANFDDPESNDINYAGKAEIHIIDLKDEEEKNNLLENTSAEDQEEDLYEEQERILEDNIIEARFIANKINGLIKSGYLVYDKKVGYRNIKYKDIVILLRATTNMAPIYEKELDNLEIPVFTDTSSEFLDSIEVQTVLALLKIMDNPMQDIPLVTVLRSAIFSFTDDDLVKIRLSNRNSNFYEALIEAKNNVDEELRLKIEGFLTKLNKWQNQINERALDELIWNIYVETNYYNYVGLMPNGNLRKANLKMLFERAKQYEKASFKGLYNFINFIDKLKASSGDMTSAKLIGENEDVVRIMSIHKSKGLEFPVVFLAGTGKSFNLQDLNDTILMHQDIGFGPKYISYEDRIEYNTLAKEAIRLNAYRETLSEEMRILYVALTRAKEKLIITGMEKDAEKSLREKEKMIELYEGKIKAEKLSPLLVKKYKKYLDWIELVFINNRENNGDICEFIIHNKNEIINNKESEKQEETTISKDFIEELKEKSEEMYNENEEIIDKIKWKYKYIDSANIPTKTSVTKIKELENENILSLEEMQNKEAEYKLLNKKPKFLSGNDTVISNSEKGTLMHLCLQKMNEKEEYNLDKIKEMVDNMCIKGIITIVQKDAININKLYQYTKSDLWNDLKMAKEVNKEKPFYINISSKELYEGDTDENILVQGIIDLYYINKYDEVILVDYKTDYVEEGNEKSLIEKYKKQLELYRDAIERSLSKKVAHTYIYSVYLNKSIEMHI